MEEMEKFNEAEEEPATFSELKIYCIKLLDLIQKPNKNSPNTLNGLLRLLQSSSSDALQSFFEYTLFPLLLLFDAAVNSRSSVKAKTEDRPMTFSALDPPHKVSDAVAEGVLNCLEELLKKCHLTSVDQMVVILKKLTQGALLSPSEASEEFRIGVIRCFRALLLNLSSCSDQSCPCKQVPGWPFLLGGEEIQSPVFGSLRNHKECLLAFLQSEPASPAIGHWLSLLLKVADVEAARGHRGSSSLRVEAFFTLRVLVAKVGTAEALAFYLPGVVSQIAKVLHVSKTMISGAASSTEALNHAIRALAEYLVIVLDDDANVFSSGDPVTKKSGLDTSKDKPLSLLLEELRSLPVTNQSNDELTVKDSAKSEGDGHEIGSREKTFTDSKNKVGSLCVKRTRYWIENTSSRVHKLISITFPNLCVHPSKRVRKGLLAAVQVLISKCSHTLEKSRLMFLECLCILVCDDSEEVSSASQAFFRVLFSSDKKQQIESDVAEVFSRLVEKLPQVVLGSEESVALSHARKLLAVTYFCGPRRVASYLHSPLRTARFLDSFSLCLSQNSVFAASLDKIVSAKPSSSGFMRSIAELTAIHDTEPGNSDRLGGQNRRILCPPENRNEYVLPRMPPWFSYVGSQKLYEALSGILRLVSVSLLSEFQNEQSLSVIIDIPLGCLRKLISEIRTKEYYNESWYSWYKRTGSGQLVRQASSAACILNEMIYGLSDQSVTTFKRMFEKADGNDVSSEMENATLKEHAWKIHLDSGSKSHLVDCIGSILHEYLSLEIWDLPIGHSVSAQQIDGQDGETSLHFFHDNEMLHQVIVEGIGLFNICLGKEFSSCGFLHSSLYMLLEHVICSNFQVRRASDAVLHVLSATHGFPTVGHLVLANSDYVIDSICRQLRRLDLNPHVPNVLAAMLSYIGLADKVLPFLEEPVRAVSVELEIIGRHQHPNLTNSFLKAIAEIAKASKFEACTLPKKLESLCRDVTSNLLEAEKKTGKHIDHPSATVNDIYLTESETEMRNCSSGAGLQLEEWESVVFKLNDSKRYRRTVGSIAGSCLAAAMPLIASADQSACLIALDVIEDGVVALARVEEAYKHEIKTKEAIEQAIRLCSLHNLQDTLDSAADETGENRLLPAANRIWPFLVACVHNKNPLTSRRCCRAISELVQICGGEFFSRRFHADGTHFWRLLTTSPFSKKPLSKQERIPLQLPYRTSTVSSEDPVSEISTLKVQAALLEMISDLARNSRSAPALEAVFKKVSGLVVGVACSGVKGLLEASVNALVGLACVDPDLIWLLLADVYYSRKKDQVLPPAEEFPAMTEILPPVGSSKDYLYVMYGGQTYGFDVDFTAVETVFMKLCASVFTSQMEN